MENSAATELKKLVIGCEKSKNIDRFNEKLKYLLKNSVQSDLVSLFTYDSEKQVLNLKLFYDKQTDTLENIINDDNSLSMINPQGCIGKVFLTKSPVIHNHITSDKDYVQAYDNALNHKLKSQLLFPILDNGKLLGIFRVSTLIRGVLQKYTQKELALIRSAEPYFRVIIKKLTLSSDSDENIKIDNLPDIKKIAEVETKVDDNDMLLFLSNTVHDIRTPANSLYGFLELLEEQIEDKRLKEFVTNAKESASFINTLTDSILETTKNRYESNISKEIIVSTVKFLSETVNIFAAKMSEKKINYFIFISPQTPKEIKIDTLKLKRILMNLIGNAYKFTPNNHRIDVTIDCDKSKNRMTVSVKDTGIGIEEENQKKLFKAFSQAKDDTSMKYGGTGLGLAISAGYVADLGGELKLKSRINEGSEFYFDIPIEVIDTTPSYENFHNLDKKIIILTDDSTSKNANYIRSYLVRLGMPDEKIHISHKIKKSTTHIICFEHKITPEVLALAKSGEVELLLIEDKLFSLLNDKETSMFKTASKNTYYGDAIHSTVFSGNKVRVLIADDNKINVRLLESMLGAEYVDIVSCLDGEKALKSLQDASKEGRSFDIVYLDKHMPGISGTELLGAFRKYEVNNQLKPIFAVSISGDPDISEDEKKLFNVFVNKPFSKHEVREVIALSKNQA